ETYAGLADSSGWMVFGGTSVSAPIIGGVYALAGNAATVNYGSYPYSHTGSLFDVTSGSNAGLLSFCSNYLCTGKAGYDGPTGNGTPHGTAGFCALFPGLELRLLEPVGEVDGRGLPLAELVQCMRTGLPEPVT